MQSEYPVSDDSSSPSPRQTTLKGYFNKPKPAPLPAVHASTSSPASTNLQTPASIDDGSPTHAGSSKRVASPLKITSNVGVGKGKEFNLHTQETGLVSTEHTHMQKHQIFHINSLTYNIHQYIAY